MFTPLETAAVTGFVSLLVALSVHVATKRNYVSHAQCEERRKNVCDDLRELKDDHESASEEHRKRTVILFRMVRSLVAHNTDMPNDVKDKILNETPGGE